MSVAPHWEKEMEMETETEAETETETDTEIDTETETLFGSNSFRSYGGGDIVVSF